MDTIISRRQKIGGAEMNKKPILTQDVLQMLKSLGLTINAQTGGFCCTDYAHQPIYKNESGMYGMNIEGKEIAFLSGGLFLMTVKMVENSLNYRLFS